MRKFFNREEKLPFSYSAIEERRGKSHYLLWIIGTIVIIVLTVFIFRNF